MKERAMSDEVVEKDAEESEPKSVEAEVIDMVMTSAVRGELHTALDVICNELRDMGKLGSSTMFELVPDGGEPGKGDTLSVTMQVMLLPMYDGRPCGYFVPHKAMDMEVH
jgi:hypothetical protein